MPKKAHTEQQLRREEERRRLIGRAEDGSQFEQKMAHSTSRRWLTVRAEETV